MNKCKWTCEGEDCYYTECGNSFIFNYDGPHENDFLYCPYCGREIEVDGTEPEDERCQKAEWINGKCRGYQISRWNEEPVESCKQCKCFEEHEE